MKNNIIFHKTLLLSYFLFITKAVYVFKFKMTQVPVVGFETSE